MLYLERIELHNLRVFDSVDIDFDVGLEPLPWSMITGDNAAGKTTLLKAIALGICDQSSAAGLLRESDTGFIRTGESEAQIVVYLRATQGKRRRRHVIETTIKRIERARGLEKVEQKTAPSFPWTSVFACGYGAGRGTSGTGDIIGYSTINSVFSLFNYAEGLQNPELVLHRIRQNRMRRTHLDILESVLTVDDIAMARGRQGSAGILVRGDWGPNMPLRDLADGYKSTFLWITDFLGWAVMHQPGRRPEDIVGIVMVDELEQHLHPKWQRSIVGLLRNAFPKIQFITTTHSPSVARSIGGVDGDNGDRLFHLQAHPTGTNKVSIQSVPTMRGWPTDQVLASPAFEWLSSDDEDVEAVIRRASQLLVKGDSRNQEEDLEYRKLRALLSEFLPEGRSPIERSITAERERALVTEMAEIRQQLESRTR